MRLKLLSNLQKQISKSRIKNTTRVLEGSVVETITESASDDSIIMLGVSPKNPVIKYFFGSKPISIAQKCKCPVLIAK